MVKKKEEKKSLVKEAIKDLDKGLGQLADEKKKLENKIKSLDLNVDSARMQEQDLQKKIADLVKKEAKLNERKKFVEGKQDVLSEKLSKVKKIKYELEEV
ncbi:MAG: hypothetical protein NT076_01060 [Candidatus Pacearchaeota archaeon]|nr:hypothetical protein [Candidatus Pacearchaeota archaeon]